jgi:N-acetylneuraminic acid mutarotase
MSTTKGVPWGISITAGIIFTVLGLGSRIMVSQDIGTPISFSLPSESKVLNIGEIPVDVMKISNIASISNPTGKGGESKRPDMQNAFMAPQAEGGKWVKKADMPIGVGFHSISEVNGKIYVMGGQDKNWDWNLKSFSTVYEYDPKTDTWSKKSDMITPRSGFGTVVVDGKIYAIDGWADSAFTNTVEVYDPIADKWEKRADSSTKRAEFAASAVNGKIYVIGGHSGVGPGLTLTEEYDPKTDTWTKKADMPTARTFLTSSVVNNKIYVFGGTNDNALSKVLSTVEIYDPSTDTWTKGSDLPTSMAILTSCAINEMIYIMNGYTVTSNPVTVEIYDTKNDKWLEGKDIPTEVGRISARNYPVLNGKIYAIGGNDSNNIFLSDVWEYTPEDLQSVVSSQDKLLTKWGNIKNR